MSISTKDAKHFITWVVLFASHGHYDVLRKQLLIDSSAKKPTREKSDVLVSELKRVFPDLTECTTDITAMKALFTAASCIATVGQMKSMMIAMNIILPLQSPPCIPERLSNYMNLVTAYRGIIRKSSVNVTTNGLFLVENRNLLIAAGGSNDVKDIKIVKKARDTAATKALAIANSNKLTVSEFDIMKAVKTTGQMRDIVDTLLFCQLMTGARKSDLVNPRFASFEIRSNPGYVLQIGCGKDKSVEKGVTPEIMAARRRVEKPVPLLNDITGKSITAATIVSAIEKLRELWNSEELIKDGFADNKLHSLHDAAIAARVRALFARAAADAESTRKNGVSSHLLRKIYGNYTYEIFADKSKITLSGWLSRVMGWSSDSALQTSLHYNDIHIDLNVPVLSTAMRDEAASTDIVVDAAIARDAKEKGIEDVVFDSTTLKKPSNVKMIIAFKQARKPFVTVKNGSTGALVKVRFYRRKKKTESKPYNVDELISNLRSAGVVVNNGVLRTFGVGAKMAKTSLVVET